MGAYCDARILTAAETREMLDRVIQPTVEATQVHRVSLCRHDDDCGRAEGAGVQCAPGRSGNATSDASHDNPTSRPVLLAAAEGSLDSASSSNGAPAPASASCWPRAATRAHTKPAMPSKASKTRRPPAPRYFTRARAWGAGPRDRRRPRPRRHRSRRTISRRQSTTPTTPRGHIQFAGMHYRRDIGHKGLRTLQ